MSIYINSNDFDSGTSSNGVWNINNTLNGQYTVLCQHLELQDYAWIWADCCTLKIKTFQTDTTPVTSTIQFSYAYLQFLTDSTSISNKFQSDINSVTQSLLNGAARTCTVTYIEDTNDSYYNVSFNGNVVLDFSDSASTIKYVFGEKNALSGTSFQLYDTYITTDPKYLEVYINESQSQYITTHDTSPALLFSTKDTEFTGQKFSIRKNVTTLTIKIYRENIPISTIPLTNQWSLVLSNS